MNKVFKSIGILFSTFLIGLIFAQISFAEESVQTNKMLETVLERHCSDVASELGEDCILTSDSSEYSDLPFYNLYLFTYKSVADGPRKEAMDKLAKMESDYTKDELEALVFNGDTSVLIKTALSAEEVEILEEEIETLELEISTLSAEMEDTEAGADEDFLTYIATSNLLNSKKRKLANNSGIGTQDQILSEYANIMQSYRKELDLQVANKKLAYQAYAMEMFFDNDLGNSANVDILHDLDLINYLLFGEFIAYPDRSGQELSTVDSVELSSEEDGEIILSNEENLSPYTCLEDSDLRSSIEAFEDYVAETSTSDSSTDSSTSSGSTRTLESYTESELEIVSDFENLISNMQSNPGDWNREEPCSTEDIFCIKINLVKGSWGTTAQSDDSTSQNPEANCISCHINFIAIALDETLSGGVHPNKIPQNWFEDGTCKDIADGINLDFNVYAIGVPIALDPKDDSAEMANKNFEKQYEELLEWSYFNTQTKQETYLHNLKLSGEIPTINSTLKTLEEINQTHMAELDEILKSADIQTKVDSAYNLYHQIYSELGVMEVFFKNYSDFLKATYSTDTSPIYGILKKPYCS